MTRRKLEREIAAMPFEAELEAIYDKILRREAELRAMTDAEFAQELIAYARSLYVEAEKI
jgi:hypothetical protein